MTLFRYQSRVIVLLPLLLQLQIVDEAVVRLSQLKVTMIDIYILVALNVTVITVVNGIGHLGSNAGLRTNAFGKIMYLFLLPDIGK